MGWLKRTFWPDPPTFEQPLLKRDVEPLEGTRMSLFNSIIPGWWAENGLSTGGWFPGDNALAERVWVANRCIQLNSQQIASMPLQFHEGDQEPAWVSNPDPNWYPNGIGDALHSVVAQVYGYGFALLWVTDRYANGFPRTWTVLDSSRVNVKLGETGRREYTFGDEQLNPERVVQIDRNPGNGVTGTSALRAYAQVAWGLLAAGNQSMNVQQGGVPQAVLKSERKLTKEQAEAIQLQWSEATTRRNGLPPVLPPELDFQVLSINPADLSLLDTQEFNAKMIAAAFGVPAVLLNMSVEGSHVYQSPSALGEMWWRFELRPMATRIANALTAQLLPRGQWVTFDAADTFLPLDVMSEEDDPQLSQVAKASPAQQNGNVVPLPAAMQRQVTFEEGAIQVETQPPSIVVQPPNVQVDVHQNGQTTRRVTFSDGRTAVIEEGELAHVNQ